MTLNELIASLQEVAAIADAGNATVYATAASEVGDVDVDLTEVAYSEGVVWIGFDSCEDGE
jgi:hypothetical protein